MKIVEENRGKMGELHSKLSIVCDELKLLKERATVLEQRVGEIEEPVRNTQRHLDHLETYHRRWNLKLFGLAETRDENVREEVIKICQAVLPEERRKLPDAIDVAHRLGRKKAQETRPRPIIFRFVTRLHRDALWKAAKNCSYLRDHDLRFKEDISKGDAERREKLWPAVKNARDARKTAYFVGGRAFIEGEGEIKLPGEEGEES